MADTATAAVVRYVPPGPERDELLGLVRVGLRFAGQRRGRRPGFLRVYVEGIVARLAARTFDALLLELEVAAMRRELLGPQSSPIEKVDRGFEALTWHCPRRGRQQTTFKRLRNIARLRNPVSR